METPTVSGHTGNLYKDRGASPVSRSPVAQKRVILLCVAALGLGLLAARWIDRLRYEEFTGHLQARAFNLSSGRPARLARVLVHPGDVVTKGQPLVLLEDDNVPSRLAAKQREISTLEIEWARSKAELEVELERQNRDISNDIFEARIMRAKVIREELIAPLPNPFSAEAAEKEAARISIVLPELPDFLTEDPVGVQTAGAQELPSESSRAVKPARPELELCDDRIRELERMHRELPAKINKAMGVDLAESRLNNARAELAAIETEQRQLTLTAEVAGLVGIFHKQVGDRVESDEPIVQLLDDEQPFLLVHIPSPRIADFAPGTVLELTFPGGLRGKGRVVEIPPQTTGISEDGSSGAPTMICVHVDPVGALWPNVSFGSQVGVRRKR
jgi:multidrug resistance efflux pump